MSAHPHGHHMEHMPVKTFSWLSALTGWGIMVVAMMFPKIIVPIRIIVLRSLRGKSLPCSFLFTLGYLFIWLLTGFFILSTVRLVNDFSFQSHWVAITGLLVTLSWQFSPLKQRCLNRGQQHITLSAFGWASYRDALHYGLSHGVWCIGSGWALMLYPMLLPQGHMPAMLVATFIMVSEHLENPRFPAWRIDFRLKLLRILLVQTKSVFKPKPSQNQ